MDSLYENARIVSAVATTGILIVWAVYTHLFYRQHRRSNRPRIVIDQVSGQGDASLCIVANMSKDPIYMECMFVVTKTATGEFSARVTGESEDLEDLQSVEIRVVATVSSEDRPIGACQSFLVDSTQEGRRFRPAKAGTEQLHGRSQKRKIAAWLDDPSRIA